MIDINNLIDDINQELLILNWRFPENTSLNCLRAINLVLTREKKWIRQIEAARNRKKPSSLSFKSFEDLRNYFLKRNISNVPIYIVYLYLQYGLRETASRLQLSHTTIRRILAKHFPLDKG